MIRELLSLLSETLRPRCTTCGRRRCRFDERRCTCPAHMLFVGGFRRGCPVHPR